LTSVAEKPGMVSIWKERAEARIVNSLYSERRGTRRKRRRSKTHGHPGDISRSEAVGDDVDDGVDSVDEARHGGM
jgi:hypothetical protein